MTPGFGSNRFDRTRATPWFRGIVLLSLSLLQVGWTANAHDLHACPHHGLHEESAVQDAPAAPDHDVHHGHDGHPDVPTADHATEHPAGEDHGPCTCIGDCAGATAVTLCPHAAEIDRAAAVTAESFPANDAILDIVSLQPYLLPFALAPPSPSV